jgi:alkanesulfonate monooxygenase SsuD/methylene tetrahydromethanopterin reductase-like flavin-dependent oxidoreductase (luciferase family)
VPIYLGGESERALTRAVRVGDGYIAQIYDLDAALELARHVGRRRREERRSGRFELMLSLWMPTAADVLRLGSAGVTALTVAPRDLAGCLARAGPGRSRAAIRESLEPWLSLMEAVRSAR